MLIQPIFAKYLNRLKCKTLTEWCEIIPPKLPVFRPICAKMAAVFLLNTDQEESTFFGRARVADPFRGTQIFS